MEVAERRGVEKQKTFIAITQFVESLQGGDRFHFKGVFMGRLIKEIEVVNEEGETNVFKKDEIYILHLRLIGICDGVIVSGLIDLKSLDQMSFKMGFFGQKFF